MGTTVAPALGRTGLDLSLASEIKGRGSQIDPERQALSKNLRGWTKFLIQRF